MDAPDDAELLEAWRGGDKVAGKELFARHFRSLYRFFANKVDPAAADDLLQETFLGCVRGRDKFQGHSSFRTYLFVVARRRLYTYRERVLARQAGTDFDAERIAALDRTPSALLVEHQEQRLLLRGLRRLPLDLQSLLELFYWEKLTSAELAEILDIPHGTVRSRLRRARDLLKTHIIELAETPALLKSTTYDFERWLQSIRKHAPARAPDGDQTPGS